jgi:hypothetical protein
VLKYAERADEIDGLVQLYPPGVEVAGEAEEFGANAIAITGLDKKVSPILARRIMGSHADKVLDIRRTQVILDRLTIVERYPLGPEQQQQES